MNEAEDDPTPSGPGSRYNTSEPIVSSDVGKRRSRNADPSQPNTFSYVRTTTTDDAFGLIPILLGVFPPDSIDSNTLLTKSFIRKYSPSCDIKQHQWNLRTGGILGEVFADMRVCGIQFYSLLHHERTLIEEEQMHAWELNSESTELKEGVQHIINREARDDVTYVKILKKINEIDAAIIAAFHTQKPKIVANATTFRKFLKNSLGKNVAAIGTEEGKDLIYNDIHTKLTAIWNAKKDIIKEFDFTPSGTLFNFDDWKGLAQIPHIWAANSTWDDAAKQQEELALTTAHESMALEASYYTELAATMSTKGFVEKLISELITEKIPTLGHSSTDLTADSKLKWKQFMGNFFRDVLIERYEILKSHLFTYYVAVAGKCKTTNVITSKAMKAIIHCTLGIAIGDKTVLTMSNNLNLAEKQRIEGIAKRQEHYKIHVDYKLPYLLTHFTEVGAKINTLSESSFASSETQISMIGVGDSKVLSQKLVKNIAFSDLADTIDGLLIFKFPEIAGADKKGYTSESKIDADTTVMHVKTHKARELLQDLINAHMCKHLNITPAVPLAHIVVSSVVHATEILDNAFAANLCANRDDVASHYLARIRHPLIKYAPAETTDESLPKLTTTTTSRNSLLNILSLKPSTIPTLLAHTGSAAYITALDKIFRLKKRIPQLLTPTPPKSPRRPRTAPAGGRSNTPGNGAPKGGQAVPANTPRKQKGPAPQPAAAKPQPPAGGKATPRRGDQKPGDRKKK